jgi:HSP20 family protein
MNSEEATQRLLKDFQNISDEMENLMRGFFSDKLRAAPSPGRGFSPSMDVFETEDEIVCLLDLPGVGLQDLQVRIEAGTMRVSGVRRELPGFERRNYHKMELDFGAFERSLIVPEPVDAGSVSVEQSGGFYLVRLCKVISGLKSAAGQDTADAVDIRR